MVKDSSLDAKNVQDAVAQMGRSTKQAYDDLVNRFDTLETSQLSSYYIIGTMLNRMEDDPGSYDDNGYQLVVAALLEERRQTIKRTQAFARMIPETEVNEIITMRCPQTGHRIGWGHVTLLLTVKSARARKSWCQKIIKYRMSARTFMQQLKASEPERPTASGGRPHRKPGTLQLCLSQVVDVLNTVLSKGNTVWCEVPEGSEDTAVLADVASLDDDNVTKELYGLLRELRDQVDDVELVLSKLKNGCETAMERYYAVLKLRGEDPDDEESEEDDVDEESAVGAA